MKVYPPFSACLKYSAAMLGYALAGAAVVGMLAYLLKHRGVSAALLESAGVVASGLLAIALAGALALASLLYLLLRVGAWTICAKGLAGRSYWGRKTTLAWSDISDIVRIDQQGIPYLKIGARTPRREIWACALGANLAAIHAELCRHAGADHELTHWFR